MTVVNSNSIRGLLQRYLTGLKFEAREMALFKTFEHLSRLFWLQLIAQSPMPGGVFTKRFTGNLVGAVDGYQLLYTNTYTNPIAVRVYSVWNMAQIGKQVKLSLTNDASDRAVVDYLGNTSSAPSVNKRISDTIILNPGETLWINTYDVTFPLTLTDAFSIREFNPSLYLLDEVWESR